MTACADMNSASAPHPPADYQAKGPGNSQQGTTPLQTQLP